MSENIRFHADTVVGTAQTYADDPEVLDRAYEKGWSYQRFARSRALERSATTE